MQRRTFSLLRASLWALAAVFAAITVVLFVLYTNGPQATSSSEAYGVPFELTDQNGRPITRDTLRGEPSAVFFGFTHCPEVCPTTLYELSSYQKRIEEKGGKFRIVFVTVDPERDTPEKLKAYVESLSDDITAITGDPEKIAAMLKGWGVYARKVGEGDDYTMDHTATTLLLNADGGLEGTIAYDESPDTAFGKIERLTGV